MSPIEIAATITGLASVWFSTRQNIWCWPTGLVMVTLYIFIFYDAKLYSDMGLQIVYIFMQIYGWYYWLNGGRDKDDGGKAKVTRLSTAQFGAAWAVGAVGVAGLGFAMSTYTDASLPYWDAATTVLSLIAQWFLGKKILESWVFWIVVDVIAIGVYLTKGLYLTSGLYLVFLGLAIAGLLEWMKTHRENQRPLSAQGA
ncbi:nicotinamide riboside transporter PnuC [Bradymonas sediminis]|uniref:Nicotinamide riboside transporter PnuC n=2 Tax=Bradymonas sediminis TaxID=1548548 RepID=A0A2Z4FRL2_9DELT|nr:nicotinamide riboside transporter PnuC [Bradymonas sediminis]